jgi:excisionase family DNA binding protein
MSSDWITTKQAAELSGYHPEHIRELVREGKVKAQKFGEVWQVDRGSLLTYLRNVEKLGERRGPKRRLTSN